MFPKKTTTLVTQEVYERYSWAVLLGRKRLYISLLLFECGFLLFAFSQFLDRDMVMMAFFLSLMIIVPLALFLGYRDQIKRTYQKNPVLHDLEHHYTFWEDCLEVETRNGTAKYHYSEIVKVIETKEAFYIMVGETMGLLLDKSQCSPDLIALIEELARTAKGGAKS